jgi:hypothetical protein
VRDGGMPAVKFNLRFIVIVHSVTVAFKRDSSTTAISVEKKVLRHSINILRLKKNTACRLCSLLELHQNWRVGGSAY